eukprot:8575018-Ditylum_brightwellii.AAC.1
MASPLSAVELQLFYRNIFQKALRYILGKSCLSTKQLKGIEQKAQHAFATKCRFNRNMKYEIRDGPEELGSANFFSLIHIQGTRQITNFLKHWRMDSITSKLLKIALAWCQYQASTDILVLKNMVQNLLHPESQWIPSLQNHLQPIEGSIEVDHSYIPAPQRDFDAFLTDLVLESAQFKDLEVLMINYCHLYLQVATLSDIVLAYDVTIDPQFLQGQWSLLSSTSNYLKTMEAQPSKCAWRLCHKTNKLWSNKGRLSFRLGIR